MASLQKDPSGNFHLAFQFGGSRFKRSLKTKSQRKAEAACSRVEENIALIEAGRMELPENIDLPTYLLSNGKLDHRPKVQSSLRLGQLFTTFEETVPADSMEATSLYTARLHMNHWVRVLGAMQALQSLSSRDVQRYVTHRSKEPGRRKHVSATTIRKEVATFRALWNWAVTQEMLSGTFPCKGIVYPKQSEKPPFQTKTQIERRTEREGLTEKEAAELWNCLYLSTEELNQVLEIVRQRAPMPYLYPMCLFAAHTGARRSEMCRARIADFDFQERTVVIQERKRSRVRRTTRVIPVSQKLAEVMSQWLDEKPLGPFIFPTTNSGNKNDLNPELYPPVASEHLDQALHKSPWQNIPGWHVFRHSFISNCASRGIDQRFIDSWVGHQTDEQRRRYRHLFPDSQQQAIDSVFI